jgi:hypothetical protein
MQHEGGIGFHLVCLFRRSKAIILILGKRLLQERHYLIVQTTKSNEIELANWNP